MSDDLIKRLRAFDVLNPDGNDVRQLAADEIARLHERLEQVERERAHWRLTALMSRREGFRAGIEAAADWIESAPRGYPHSAYRDSIRALAAQKGDE